MDANNPQDRDVDVRTVSKFGIGLVCGVPPAVFSTGVQEQGAVQYLTTQYLYGTAGPCVSCSSGALAMKARPFSSPMS